MTNSSTDRDEAVHQARRCFKRIRSALRLVRTALPRKVYRLENQFYRNAGRHLACLREASALLQTLDRLSQTHKVSAQLSDVSSELRRMLHAAHALESLNAVRLMATEAETLRAAQKRIADWPLELDATQLPEGVFTGYALGRACMAKAKRKTMSANFHAWRKQARYLHEHLKLLKPLDPAWLGDYASELKELENYLSEMQDLAVFQQWLMQLVAQEVGEMERLEPLLHRLNERQAALRALIKPLGEQLYAWPPAAFRKRLMRGAGGNL